ncbi:MAG: hypothetical protein JSS87_05460 [Acidobacteria bacterium]|nr:hypothetical protein [Acidobacteriota bacterium]
MRRRARLNWILGLAFVLGAAIAVVWMFAILRVSDDPDIPVNMGMKVMMFFTCPPFLLSYASGGALVYSVPVLNGLLYAGIAWIWSATRTKTRASRGRR